MEPNLLIALLPSIIQIKSLGKLKLSSTAMDQMHNIFEMEEEYIFWELLDEISLPMIRGISNGEEEIILRDCLAGNKKLMKDYFFNYAI